MAARCELGTCSSPRAPPALVPPRLAEVGAGPPRSGPRRISSRCLKCAAPSPAPALAGAVKITPAHDPNDFQTGKRHGLEFINVFDDNGNINGNGTGQFAGQPRFKASPGLRGWPRSGASQAWLGSWAAAAPVEGSPVLALGRRRRPSS